MSATFADVQARAAGEVFGRVLAEAWADGSLSNVEPESGPLTATPAQVLRGAAQVLMRCADRLEAEDGSLPRRAHNVARHRAAMVYGSAVEIEQAIGGGR